MGKVLDEISSVSGHVYQIGLLVVAIVLGVVYVTRQDTQIRVNTIDLQDIHKAQAKEHMIRDQRSDKRYKRAQELGHELKELVKEHESRIRATEIDQAYNKGLREGLRRTDCE